MNLNEILKQKSTWAGIAAIVTGSLPLFGVPTDIVAGIAAVVGGLAIIFLRQGIAKVSKK
jgi:membrane protein implicated in regulation of membrane protease activity